MVAHRRRYSFANNVHLNIFLMNLESELQNKQHFHDQPLSLHASLELPNTGLDTSILPHQIAQEWDKFVAVSPKSFPLCPLSPRIV
jgi:hypothetical protein